MPIQPRECVGILFSLGFFFRFFSSSLRAKRRSKSTLPSRPWIASRSLSSGARSRDPLAGNDGLSNRASPLVAIGDRQFLAGKQRDDLTTPVGDDDLLLDARRRNAVGRRTVGLEREHHAGLDLHRIF